MRKTALSIAAIAGLAASASAQNSINWSWDVQVNGADVDELLPIVVATGDNVSVSLSSTWAPPGTGFAGSIFAITGTGDLGIMFNGSINIDQNSGLGRNPALSALSGDNGVVMADRIDQIDTFQLPPFFNPGFDASNPMSVYSFEFVAGTGTDKLELTRSAALNGTFTNDIYIDTFGSSLPYDSSTDRLSFVIPAPSTMALLGLSGIVAGRRRR